MLERREPGGTCEDEGELAALKPSGPFEGLLSITQAPPVMVNRLHSLTPTSFFTLGLNGSNREENKCCWHRVIKLS